MSSIIDGLVSGFRKNQDYGTRLVADLSPDQMLVQPVGERELPVNHPAWVFSHMNVYLPVIASLIKGETFADPKDHQFGMLSSPQMDAAVYSDKESLIRDWDAGHETAAELLGKCNVEVFEQPVMLERWATIMPTVGISLPYLMLNHENMHLGQISAWRRVLGLPSV